MIGVADRRAATVVAETLCSLWEICQSSIFQFMEKYPAFKKSFTSLVSAHLEHTVAARLTSLPLLRDFDRQFRTLLSISCKRCVYYPNEVIASKGERGTGTLAINVGEALWEAMQDVSSICRPGSSVGAGIMLGIQKTLSGTLTALTVCHVLVITREAYLTALNAYPSPASTDALMEATKREIAAFQAKLKQRKLQTFVTKRCTATVRVGSLRSIHVGLFQATSEQAFRAWASHAKARAGIRKHEQSRQSNEQEWIARHVHARERKVLESHLAHLSSQRFDWVARVAWDGSTQPTCGRPRRQQLPRIAPISGPPLRPRASVAVADAVTPRMTLPPV